MLKSWQINTFKHFIITAYNVPPVLCCILWGGAGGRNSYHVMFIISFHNFPVANSAGVSSSTCHICPAVEVPDAFGTSMAFYLRMTFRKFIKGTNRQERCHMRVW
jgi:hypothetical protein